MEFWNNIVKFFLEKENAAWLLISLSVSGGISYWEPSLIPSGYQEWILPWNILFIPMMICCLISHCYHWRKKHQEEKRCVILSDLYNEGFFIVPSDSDSLEKANQWRSRVKRHLRGKEYSDFEVLGAGYMKMNESKPCDIHKVRRDILHQIIKTF